MRPGVGREAAIGTAATLAERTGRWDAHAPGAVHPEVVVDEDQRQRLAWAVTFPSKPDPAARGRPGLRVLIDAHTGAPLSAPS